MSKTIIVHERFRKNYLSLKPGGYSVTVVYSTGTQRIYNNVKNPKAYINSIAKDETIVKTLVDGEVYWTR
jgi:hypothetical protein